MFCILYYIYYLNRVTLCTFDSIRSSKRFTVDQFIRVIHCNTII